MVATVAVLRRMVGAPLLGRPPARCAVLLLDAWPALIGFALFLLATGRPILAGLGVASLGLGLVVTERVKRLVLDEPVVFADRAELWEVLRHPRFYIAFVGTVPMLAGIAALLALVGFLVWIEPPLWTAGWAVSVGLIVLALVLGRAAFVVPTLPPLLRMLERAYRRLAPSLDPETDARRLGLLATFLVHAVIARSERPGRRAAVAARGLPAWPRDAGPVILWQAESFVDARRLHPALAERLPHYATLVDEAVSAGRLEVPCWGANTIRTELAVVAGLSDADLGLDRFNPYEAFAQAPLPSLARSAREAGYRTVCVHPYTRSFYARDKVIPQLGFDRFIGIEAFADTERDGGYVTDRALASFVADLVRREGPDIFVFAISIENHGPWDDKHDHLPHAHVPEDWLTPAQTPPFGRWLRHIEATDRAIPLLRAPIEEAGRGWLGFYGDHQPSLQGAFHVPGAPDRRSDYALWRPGGHGAARRDLAAGEVAGALLQAMQDACRDA